MLTTTTNEILKHNPCVDVWVKLTGQSKLRSEWSGNDEVITFNDIFNSNGFDDTLWACRVLEVEDLKRFKLLICDFAESALKYVNEGDGRPRLEIETARDYINGNATLIELKKAKDATNAAAAYAAADAYAYADAYAAASAAYAASASAAAADAVAVADADAAADAYAGYKKERKVQESMLIEFISK